MRKQTICVCENKGANKDADQLRSYCDQRLCFRYKDSSFSLLSKSKISSLLPSSLLVQLDLCRTCSKTTSLVFS